jgi:hypothetical protein
MSNVTKTKSTVITLTDSDIQTALRNYTSNLYPALKNEIEARQFIIRRPHNTLYDVASMDINEVVYD